LIVIIQYFYPNVAHFFFIPKYEKSHHGKVFYHSAGIFGGFERLLRNDKHQRFLRNDKAIVSWAWFARVAFKRKLKMQRILSFISH
jgi:hypothetical protein